MDESSIYSSDDHLDLRSVPRQLWQDRRPEDLAERGPRVVTGEGDPMWVCNHRILGRSGLPQGDKLQLLSAVSRAGLEDDGFRVSNPKLRLEYMDLDGVWASVIYGPIPLTLSIPEPDLQAACYSAWNDWAIEEFNAFAPDRLCALPFLPTSSPEASVAELERVAERGHRGAIVDVFDIDAGDPAWDRPGRPPSRPDCRSASISRKAHPRGSATRSASGSRPRSPPSFPCSSTRRSPSWRSSGALEAAPRARRWSWPRRASGGCRTS